MPIQAYITSDRLPKEITPGLFWLGGCSNSAGWPGREHLPSIHEPLATYLIVGEDCTLLVDTGHFALWYALEPQLESVLGGRSLDYVLPSHPELPHSGNLGRLLKKYPESVAVGDMRDYHVYFPEIGRDRLIEYTYGESLDLGGTNVEFVAPIWRDLTSTMWLYEPNNQALFPSDGLGYLHEHVADVCGLLASELPPDYSPTNPRFFANKGAFHWMPYHDMTPSVARFRELLVTHPVAIVCSAHGAPVDVDVASFTEVMLDGVLGGGVGSSLNDQR